MIIHTLSRAEGENITDHYPEHFPEKDETIEDREETVAIISIGPPGKITADLNEFLFDDVLRLHFHDADPNVETGQVQGMKLMSTEQARTIREFVNVANPDVLFVQCQAGQSRSCGVAYALHRHYNDGDLKQGWENFNRFVHNLVMEGFEGETWEEKINKAFNNNDE